MGQLSDITYPLASFVAIGFGVFALTYAYLRRRAVGHDDSPEFFLTARGSISLSTIAWSLYTCNMGAWAFFATPSFALTAGPLGVIVYSLSIALPLPLVAYFGVIVQGLVPNVMSLSDFINRRYGRVLSCWVGFLTCFNMGIDLAAEYTAIGDVFEFVVHAARWPIVLIIALTASIYTAFGGLYVSVVTDQWQAILSVVVFIFLFIYVGVTFKHPLGPLPNNYLGKYDLTWTNYFGFASIGALPVSNIASAVFTETFWQRCWASASKKTLVLGASLASIGIFSVLCLLGFGGLLAAWGGVWVPDGPDDSGNTILFSLLGGKTWVLVLITVCAVALSESVVDNLTNALVDTVSLTYFSPLLAAISPTAKINLIWIRALVLIGNIAPVMISLLKLNIVNLFLMTNLVMTTSLVPVLLGVIPGRRIQKIVTPFSAFFGCGTGVTSLFVWSVINQRGESYSDSLFHTFMESNDFPPFIIALTTSVAGLGIGSLVEFIFRMCVPSCREYPFYNINKHTATDNILEDEKLKDEIRSEFPLGLPEGEPLKAEA